MINRSARLLAIFLLLVNAAAALYGGWSLMTDSSGAALGLPPEWISRLPFRNYFIPGVMLFLVNGIFSVLAAIATISRSRGYEKFVIVQGCLLIAWIFVQVIILHTTGFLHFATAGIGLTLLGLGFILIIDQMREGVGNHS